MTLFKNLRTKFILLRIFQQLKHNKNWFGEPVACIDLKKNNLCLDVEKNVYGTLPERHYYRCRLLEKKERFHIEKTYGIVETYLTKDLTKKELKYAVVKLLDKANEISCLSQSIQC